jgi:hypothetical protein
MTQHCRTSWPTSPTSDRFDPVPVTDSLRRPLIRAEGKILGHGFSASDYGNQAVMAFLT